MEEREMTFLTIKARVYATDLTVRISQSGRMDRVEFKGYLLHQHGQTCTPGSPHADFTIPLPKHLADAIRGHCEKEAGVVLSQDSTKVKWEHDRLI